MIEETGQLLQVLNISNKQIRLRFDGDNLVYFDFIEYSLAAMNWFEQKIGETFTLIPKDRIL